MKNDELLFAQEENVENCGTLPKERWKILVVDDDMEVHSFTKLALHDFSLHGKTLAISSAYSAAEAIKILAKEQFSIILLDVVMESNNAGFDVVEFLRNRCNDAQTRILIRTGQPGEAPERFVIDHYDINDYKEKTELTTDRLYTTIRTALSQYKQLMDLQNSKNEMYTLLVTDSLTGLPNRFKLNEDLDSSKTMSLVMMDIDGFSLINDTYGFEIGDRLLLEMRDKLNRILSIHGLILYRLEADIFAALLQNRMDGKLDGIINDIRDALAGHIFKIGPMEVRVSMTVGVVRDDIGNMIQKAEIALREARSIGRNRVEVYSDKLQIIQKIHENNKWSSWLRDALEADKVLAYYQPIVDCSNDTIVKYEALVRLEREGVVYTPFHFLSAARYSGLLHYITRRMIEKSFALFKSNTLKLSINITDVDLMEKGFLEFIEEVREHHGIDRSRISFELLEETSLSDNALAQEQLHAIIAAGYGIVIDDFGVQCSNFGQMGTMHLEALKIDGKFIKDIVDDEHSQSVTESIVFFAKKKHFPVVAEFVHSREIYEIVKSMGVDYAQGYFLGEPKEMLVE
jgi:diguanylate cyclase (GGDEF)-like protein